MKTFKTFDDAFLFQTADAGWNHINLVETQVDVLDLVQFTVGEVVWFCIAEDYYLDDYEESVTQYGVTADGRWAAVYGGHCSCYGWEEMTEDDITYYDDLSTLLKADPQAVVITKYIVEIMEVYPFMTKGLLKWLE